MAIIALSPGLSGHLKRQLIFLRNSVAAYDNGCVEEAIRIGVVIRVLCHDTQSSLTAETDGTEGHFAVGDDCKNFA